MRSSSISFLATILICGCATPAADIADSGHDSSLHSAAPAPAVASEPGQGAFAAIAEIVRLLEADSTTDWGAVDLEALRQHLADMDAVTLDAAVTLVEVPDGAQMDVTGDRRVEGSIQRIVVAHAGVLEGMGTWRATATPISGGARLTVTSRTPGDASSTARIRGLGFIGLLVQGDHHTVHHLALARGSGAHAHNDHVAAGGNR